MSPWRVVELHVEVREASGWQHLDERRMSGVLTEVLGVIGALAKKSTARKLRGVPKDASATTRAALRELKPVGVSELDATALGSVAWEKGPLRKGLVEPEQYARILAGEPVMTWSKGALGVTLVDNDEMARRLASNTTDWRMRTVATWTEKLKHRASEVYELYTQHLAGHDDRRLIAAWRRG
ncbi:MAG: hypothetical protein U0271_45050 [Polyangiaceae bacterium]